MPEKKGTTKKADSAKKSKKSAKPAAAKEKTAAAPKESNVAAKQPKRREIGAIVCLFLTVFAFLGYFDSDGWFIQFFRSLLGGLVGRGFYR